MLRTTTPRRRGFTLIELMVAAAVAVLIMSILATAFSLGIDTMRQMRAAGEMMDQLRGAENAIKADLAAPHLRDGNDQAVKLSSIRWDRSYVHDDTTLNKGDPGKYSIRLLPASGTFNDAATPKFAGAVKGFFRLSGSPLTYQTGLPNDPARDSDDLLTASGTATDHYLHFTSIVTGSNDDEYFRATVPNVRSTPPAQDNYHSIASEVAYFLEQSTPAGVSPTLFRLIRRQRLVALNDTDRRDRPWPIDPSAYTAGNAAPVISLRPQGTKPHIINTLSEITQPASRLGGIVSGGPGYVLSPGNDTALSSLSGARAGDDVLLSNVLSFEVLAIYTSAPAKMPGSPLTTPPLTIAPTAARGFALGKPTTTTTSEFPFDTVPKAPAAGNNAAGLQSTFTFDSWSNALSGWADNVDPNTGAVLPGNDVPPLLIRVQAVQVRIRVWDQKLQTGRQLTIIQDL